MKFQRFIAFLLVTGIATAAQSEEKKEIALDKAVQEETILAKYNYIDTKKVVPTHLLRRALLAYDQKKSELKRPEVVSVIDYSQRSDKPRFYIIDMETGAVKALHVAHGKGSDPNHDGFAKKFSNTPESLMTSLGVFVTAETYYGQHGRSLRLDGLSKSNSNARERDIVIHGASYVVEANQVQGRSFGCPAVSQQKIDKLIDTIGGGSLILAGLSKD